MKLLTILGCLVALAGFSLAMQTALTPQNTVHPVRPASVRVLPRASADSDSEPQTKPGGCCAKKAQDTGTSGCKDAESSGCTETPKAAGCPRHASHEEIKG